MPLLVIMGTGIGNAVKTWIPVFLIGMSTFIFVTSEMMPVGLLPDIAVSIGHTEATTGLLMTGYAWIVMLGSLPLTLLTASVNRRKLLLLLITIFVVGNLLCSLAYSFGHLFGARIVIAGAHCIFWAVTPPLAARLAPQGREGLGLAVIGGGSILASVLGVPIGTFLGHQLGWRITFASIGSLAFLIGLILFFLLPSLPSTQAGDWRSLPSLIKNKTLMAAYAVIAFIVSGHFLFYTYFVPYLHKVFHLQEDGVVFTLLICGVSGALGILLGGLFAVKHLRLLMVISASTIIGMMFCVDLFQTSYLLSLLCLVAWSIAMNMMGLCFQVWILDLAPNAKDTATAIQSGIFNFGIGGGALYGSIALRHMGVEHFPLLATVFIVPGIFLIMRFVRNPQPRETELRKP